MPSSATIRSQMQEKCNHRSTIQLLADLHELDKRRLPNGQLPSNAERLVAAMISDTIENRHDLGDAMDTIFEGDFKGRYVEALELSIAARNIPTADLEKMP